MKIPSIIGGIVVAAVLTAAAVPMVVFLPALFSSRVAFTLIVGSMCAAYCVYMLIRGFRRSGKVLLALFVLLGICSGAAFLSVPMFLLGCLALLWLIRCISSYRSILSSGIDAAVVCTGMGFAAWAYMLSGSIVAGIWCFFLTQALHVCIPSSWGSKRRAVYLRRSSPPVQGFDAAHLAAEEALQAIVENSAA